MTYLTLLGRQDIIYSQYMLDYLANIYSDSVEGAVSTNIIQEISDLSYIIYNYKNLLSDSDIFTDSHNIDIRHVQYLNNWISGTPNKDFSTTALDFDDVHNFFTNSLSNSLINSLNNSLRTFNHENYYCMAINMDNELSQTASMECDLSWFNITDGRQGECTELICDYQGYLKILFACGIQNLTYIYPPDFYREWFRHQNQSDPHPLKGYTFQTSVNTYDEFFHYNFNGIAMVNARAYVALGVGPIDDYIDSDYHYEESRTYQLGVGAGVTRKLTFFLPS